MTYNNGETPDELPNTPPELETTEIPLENSAENQDWNVSEEKKAAEALSDNEKEADQHEQELLRVNELMDTLGEDEPDSGQF